MTMENFWHNLLPHNHRNASWENKSTDIVVKGCFDYYDTTACVRNSLLTFFGLFSLLMCTLRISKLHILHHPQIHQYLVFYSACFELIFLIVKWIAVNSLYQMEYVASYLKMIQFVLLCHFHWSLVSRILHQQKLINWIIVPLLVGFLSFFSFVTVLGLLSHFTPSEECLAPHWTLLSLAEFVGIQLYVVAGIYITRKINSVSALDSFKWEQKRDLWSVIIVYEFSSASSLVYFISLRAVGSSTTGCSEIFNYAQNIYSPVYGTLMVIKYLLPIWVMLFIFYPTRGCLSSEDQRLLGCSLDGSTTSVFSPATRFLNSYKQLILPIQNVFVSENSGLRRSASSPAIFTKPNLTPISEESSILPPSRIAYFGYGAMDSVRSQPETANVHESRTRSRHDSGMPSTGVKYKTYQVPVSLNHCADEMESVTPSSIERA
ncbi:uncharacterized protein TNCT_304901 [Trichonephila clavata]|uniref:Uncharacterized protein n=2 Tax=Trichonephila clavata TaxID=2740835 RepID=A0A8X6LVP5_TRICU|nr:uncharacterized protein TNCT_304901 [Trichonephila clavata]